MTDDVAQQSGLPAIIALARAGALDQAWERFRAGGHDRDERPPALALKGRLLKDRASRARGTARLALYREAASAYASAAGLERATYPLINAATLSLLSGDREGAELYASDVLRHVDDDPDEPETPYYRVATRAEALLLLDRTEDARAAFADAVALAPRAWEDHATTLRQFGLILAAQGRATAWLDAFRPPRSLHFGGHMSFDPKVGRRAHLEETIAAALEEEDVGFGFGALAAGADILVAEALLARDGEVHLILPGGVEAFAARSVDPFGAEWRARFDAVLARAETVRPIRPLDRAPDVMTIALADEAAMGAALINARRLESSAVQLMVVDPDAAPAASDGTTGRAQARWAGAGRRQRLIAAPREAIAPQTGHSAEASPRRRPLAVLAVRTAEEGEEGLALEARLAGLQRAIAALPPAALAPYWSAGQILLGYAEVAEAARAALALAGAGHRVGGHYLVAVPFADPFSGSERLPPAAVAAAAAAAASTPPGSACVTDDFAAALAVAGEAAPGSEYVGELDPPDAGPPVGLFALKPR